MVSTRRGRDRRKLIGPIAIVASSALGLLIWARLEAPGRTESPVNQSPVAVESYTPVVQGQLPSQVVEAPPPRSDTPVTPVPEPTSSISQSSSPVARARLSAELPRWLRLSRESALWSGPEAGVEFTRVPPASTVRVLDRSGNRFRVYYSGDEEIKRPGEAWIDGTDVVEASWPRFVRTRTSTVLRTSPAENAPVALQVPGRMYLEVLETSGRDWAHVYLAARHDTGEPLDAWIDGEDVYTTPRDPSEYVEYSLTRDLVGNQTPDVWLRVPYRSQLDGAAYEAANCGPTVLWMALQQRVAALPPPGTLRTETLSYQDIDRCDECGVYIEHLASVAEKHGASTIGPFENEAWAFHRWTADEIRTQLRQGNVVIPQVMFRFLSGRERSDYWGDHYVVITGYTGDRFIYHDPIDTRGPGSSRTISTERLMKAMENSDYPFAAFAVIART
jgi:hypothetical protein